MLIENEVLDSGQHVIAGLFLTIIFKTAIFCDDGQYEISMSISKSKFFTAKYSHIYSSNFSNILLVKASDKSF